MVAKRHTSSTPRPLSISEGKAALARMVKEGKITPAQAELIDIRESTPRERATAERLGRERAARKEAA